MLLSNDKTLVWLKMLEEIRQAKHECEEREKDLLAKIKDFMGDSEILVDEDGIIRASYKASKPATRFDVSRFRAEQSEQYNQYLLVCPAQRRFLLKKENS